MLLPLIPRFTFPKLKSKHAFLILDDLYTLNDQLTVLLSAGLCTACSWRPYIDLQI